ncbi:nitroreductase family protein [Chryseobacterium chendengshani]|uniref:Acg family FMN-binding oxidoreductase n=1 Tax=Chryseobacterium sp. LJ668 TaxID=2864040 RepID=UPI001C687ED2|nr:nitroreductase family protein [Chryseobacterium sp. LJ668]MBW8523758.1 nitroreductase family protein [Chryseobacterium sp. LJ668]QYK16702.1 nitroreductase family protein [Chryseobacterium sp. LJ668]
MDRRKFIKYTSGTIVIAGITYYLTSDTFNFERADLDEIEKTKIPMQSDEMEILILASLAPSGHNTQPWFVKYHEPFHWTICNDKMRWLDGVDPMQRETILSIGAFLQNLEYAANNLGYSCEFNLLATTNQDEEIINVKLSKALNIQKFEIEKIRHRRTLRSHYLDKTISREDLDYVSEDETDFIRYYPNTSKEHLYLNEQTIEANRLQSYRDAAQTELANWIRFSNEDVEKYQDGLTPASMEIMGISGWIVRNFYDTQSVMKKDFREKSIAQVIEQVSQSAGWLVITSRDNSVLSLLDAGRRLQRIWLKVRDRNIAIHPMTQILEEEKTKTAVDNGIGIKENIQFLLRVGYVENYPEPVTLRRHINLFVNN